MKIIDNKRNTLSFFGAMDRSKAKYQNLSALYMHDLGLVERSIMNLENFIYREKKIIHQILYFTL